MTHEAVTSDWQHTANVLAIRLDNLGDVLMTTPALAAIAEGGRRRVTLLASRSGAAVAGHVGSLSDVITYDAPWVKRPDGSSHASAEASADASGSINAAANAAADRALIDRLAAHRFDAAVVFTVATQSALPAALMCRLAGIPRCLAASRENPYALLTDWVRDTEVVGEGMRHEVVRQLALVRAVGFETADERLVFEPTADEVDAARHKLAAAGIDPARPFAVVHVGSTAASRRYPADRFGIAAHLLHERSSIPIVFVGSADETPSVEAAQAAMGTAAMGAAAIGSATQSARPTGFPSASLAGLLTVGELAALIGAARLLVCNNSGPAHLAAAAGTPVVVLYALTNPQHTPWQVASRVLSHDVPCRNCLKSVCTMGHHDCLLKITPAEVADAALALLHAHPRERLSTLPRSAIKQSGPATVA